jgi:hypothetical protein
MKGRETMTMKVKTVHYINGYNVSDMTKEDLISEISKAEAKIKELKKVETESTAIAAEIERIGKFIADVVAHLDARA